MHPEQKPCHSLLKVAEEGCIIVSVVTIDMRAAFTNLLM